jgi:hypothetical protein
LTKLTERALVKDLIGIARADLIYDTILNGMIDTASDRAEEWCRRKFAYGLREEFHQSYEQSLSDPNPQYVWLDGPIDPAVQLIINWSWNEWQDFAQELSRESYTVDLEQGLIVLTLKLASPGYSYSPFPYSRQFVTSPTGFKVKYAGGYPVSAPPTTGYTFDPSDDYGVVQVPDGLKLAVAQKVAADFTNNRIVTPWSDDQLQLLRPYKKKDMIG